MNDPPVAGDATASGPEDSVISWVPLVSDVEGDSLMCFIAALPSSGSASAALDCSSGTYTPDPDFNGPDAFIYQVFDGSAADTGSVLVTVVAVNDPPVAGDTSAAGDEDSSIAWAPSVSDVDGDALTCTIASSPASGSASVSADCSGGTYLPEPGFVGEDSFVYRASDAQYTDTGSVTITVAPTNDPPSAGDTSAAGDEDTVLPWLPAVTDEDGDALTCVILSPPANGSATVAFDCSSGTYTPDPNFNGADLFMYQASDGEAADSGVVSVTVFPVNDPPVAGDATAGGLEGKVIAWLPAVADVDGDSLTCYVATLPTGGTATVASDCSGGTYTPAAGFTGVDSFAYGVSDASAADTGAVTITVSPAVSATLTFTPTDDATVWGYRPTTKYGSASTVEVDRGSSGNDKQAYVEFVVTGVEGSVTSAEIRLYVTNSSNNGGSIWSVSDTGWSESAITWATKPPIDGPMLSTLGSVSSGTWVSFDVTSAITGDGTNSFVITPNSYDGADYSSTEAAFSRWPVLEVSFEQTNFPPVANDDSAGTIAFTPVTIDVLANDTDPDGDALAVASVTQGASGSVVANPDGTVTYSPDAGFTGTDSFTYVVSDGRATDSAAVTVTVTPAATAITGLSLASTYESISVYLSFQGDDNENSIAILEYREAGGPWTQGMVMTVDRRAVITHSSRVYTNTFRDQWRASVLGLRPGTQYDVRVTVIDPEGVGGANPAVASISTRVETDQIPSIGRSLYVSTSGSDSSGDGSSSKPWRSIQRAADAVLPGDTVHVSGGTYYENVAITRSGASDNYITFSNRGSDTVVVRPQGDVYDQATNGFATDASYIRIKGFRIEGGHTAVRVAEDSKWVIVEDNFITDFSQRGMGIRIGSALVGPDGEDRVTVENITVQNNTIEPTIRQSVNDHGGIESSSYNLGGHVIRYNTIRFRYISDGNHGEDCIQHQLNTAYSDSFKDTDIYGNVCIGATDDAIELDGNNVNTRVWDNTIIGSNVGFSIGASAVGPTYIFRNVVSKLAYQWNRCIGIKEGRNGTGHVFIYHNTFYMTGDACGSLFPSGQDEGFALSDAAGDPSTNIFLKNNIFWVAERGISVNNTLPGDLTSDYNLYHDEDGRVFAKHGDDIYWSLEDMQARSDFETHGVQALPLFVNAAADDFRLLPGSPGIDDGAFIQGFNDAASAWAYSDSAPDIGAFESE